MNEEVSAKLELMRQTLAETGVQAIRLRGTDWFAWATAGASHTVLLTAETGVAEVLVTSEGAWILTDEIEAQRLKDEELPPNFQVYISSWAEAANRETFVCEVTNGGKVLSDKPIPVIEQPLPASLQNRKRVLMPRELERYRQIGLKASQAMTEVLTAAEPTWTEYQLAGAGAEALWARGLHPAVTLVAGERRLPLYRHATPTGEEIGRQAMLVFCARGYGLYANLTRFVSFGNLSNENAELHRHVREIEAFILNLSQPGTALDAIYRSLDQAYGKHGFPHAIREHHQGGITGYLAREIVATPTTTDTLAAGMAVAWNPSLAGAKVEDTFVILEDGKLENLTFDSNFPSVEVGGRSRPVPLVK
ncbi:M24 family metallopeptidase [Anabaena cylindrica FACHB-243]|uniref:Peptidase M24 n=1 Tax=Anabaena cylindrica (strain ATCC 27899 / PCC 7122) TaxID=272123 RepID=K9ZGB8_ANACC|nr:MULTISPECIES: M24 family metallopeptidase [Anabaena]AFZ57415.1 peptidase M24 [Anabaena cylindrica PCC 7122]MBD2421097.1 M24 family metallopeptidase [Anabaena cylindrica FACHB-243]MCM2405850.1 M24 family metallopeptidase [Anabaena sp. CCAP 1446/1C]BAY05594.1 peptidase M24 [Anabaena cylindrica PCC 7122]